MSLEQLLNMFEMKGWINVPHNSQPLAGLKCHGFEGFFSHTLPKSIWTEIATHFPFLLSSLSGFSYVKHAVPLKSHFGSRGLCRHGKPSFCWLWQGQLRRLGQLWNFKKHPKIKNPMLQSLLLFAKTNVPRCFAGPISESHKYVILFPFQGVSRWIFVSTCSICINLESLLRILIWRLNRSCKSFQCV